MAEALPLKQHPIHLDLLHAVTIVRQHASSIRPKAFNTRSEREDDLVCMCEQLGNVWHFQLISADLAGADSPHVGSREPDRGPCKVASCAAGALWLES
jgi:hypothetical protein